MSIRLRITCMVALCAILSSTALVLGAGIAAACSGAGGGGCEAPTASTGSASSITSNSATLSGSVNAQGCTTYYVFEWGTSSSGPFPDSIEGSAGKETFPKTVSTNLTGLLQPSTQYYFRLSAINSEGKKATGSAVPFKTPPACPTPFVKTEPASNIKLDSATLKGLLNPFGCNVLWKLEWGPSSGAYPYFDSGAVGGSSIISVSTVAPALEPGNSYHFRLSVTPTGGTPTYGSTETFSAAPLTDYVALGDSYSAGTGTGPVFTEPVCRQSVYSYPYKLYNAHKTEWKFIDKACHGAVTGDVINTQVNALTEKTKWVTYTIGGNDAGFKEVLKACFFFGSNCSALLKKAKDIIEGTLPAQLDKINYLIKLKAKWAKVIVLDYPRIFKVQPEDCDTFTAFLEADMIEMNKLVELLGKKLHEAALRAGPNFIFKSVISIFNTHALCDAQPWLNNYSDSSDDAETFHPNKLGHEQGYYQVAHGVTG